MVDAVVLRIVFEVGPGGLHEHETERGGELLQRRHVGGGGQGVGMEGVGVLAGLAGGVALRVDRDEQHPRPGRFRHRFPLLLRLRQLGQGGRAHVRAEGETQEHQGPVAGQFTGHQRGAVGLAQVEGGQLARLWQQGHRFQLRCLGLPAATEQLPGGQQAQAGGERGHEDPGGGAIEHARAFRCGLWTGHDTGPGRWPCPRARPDTAPGL